MRRRQSKLWLVSFKTRLNESSLRRWVRLSNISRFTFAFFRVRWRSPTCHPVRSRRWRSSGSFIERNPSMRLEQQYSLRCGLNCHLIKNWQNVTHCSQIERMFLKAAADEPAPPGMSRFQDYNSPAGLPHPYHIHPSGTRCTAFPTWVQRM